MPLYPQGGGLYPDSIANDLLAHMPDGTIKGRALGSGEGNPVDLTSAQVAAIVQGQNLSYRNILGRNGGFEVWQRGAGGSASIGVPVSVGAYTADGWWMFGGANQAATVIQLPRSGVGRGSRWAAVVQRNAGQTGTGIMMFEFPLDTDEIVPMQGKIVTLALDLFAGTHWSPASGNITVRLFVGTGAPAKRYATPYTGEQIAIDASVALTATQTRYSFTSAAPVLSSATQASLLLMWTPVGTAGASDSFGIDDVQLEIGSVATPFERRPFEAEFAACKRHFQKSFGYAVAPAQNIGANTGESRFPITVAGATFQNGPFEPLPVAMRVAPTVTGFNPAATNGQIRNLSISGDHSTIGIGAHERYIYMNSTGNSAGVVGHVAGVHWTADAGI